MYAVIQAVHSLHSKVQFLQCCHMKRYNKIFTKICEVYSLLWDTVFSWFKVIFHLDCDQLASCVSAINVDAFGWYSMPFFAKVADYSIVYNVIIGCISLAFKLTKRWCPYFIPSCWFLDRYGSRKSLQPPVASEHIFICMIIRIILCHFYMLRYILAKIILFCKVSVRTFSI